MFAVDLLDRGDTTVGSNASLSVPSVRPSNALNDFDCLPKVKGAGMVRLFLWCGSPKLELEAPISSDVWAISAKIPERKADPYDERKGWLGSSDEIWVQDLFLAEEACWQLESWARRGLIGVMDSALLSLSILWRANDISAALASSATDMATEQGLHDGPSPLAIDEVVFLVVALN